MSLPHGFQFSQASLQDFADCPRRFQLRYLHRLAWPAIESEPALENERFMQQGQRFHRLVQQHQLGLPTERLARMIADLDLECWWENYLTNGLGLSKKASRRWVEAAIYAPLNGFRLVAKYDALVFFEAESRSKVLIIDWKTSRKRSSRRWLASRMQTRVYPYLLLKAGASLNNGIGLDPTQLEMIYWFASFPEQPERFVYSQEQCRLDEAFLLDLVAQIEGLGKQDFPLALDEGGCRFCTYRSLCSRGVGAGRFDDFDEPGLVSAGEAASLEMDIDLDFEQISEIKF